MDINYELYKVFYHVAVTLSFSDASRQLYISQSAVSQSIKVLEKKLNQQLFIRSTKRVQLTPEGEIVVQYAQRMAALYNRLQKELSDTEKQPVKLCVGLTHTAESNLTTEVLAKCSSEKSGFTIMIVTDTINNLYTMLENYELDLAIVEGNASHPSMNSLVLNTDFLVCVMSADNPLSRNALVTLEELKRERMILRLPTSATRELFDSSLRSMKDSPDNYNIILEVDNIATIKDLVRKNLGVSVLPQSACLKELRKGSLTALPIENLSMVRETRLVYNRDFRRKDILRTITRVYRETARAYQ